MFRLTRKEKLLWLTLAGVVLPLIALLWLQYRSLSDLRQKTGIALESNLRRTAQQLQSESVTAIERYAREVLGKLDNEKVKAWQPGYVRNELVSLRQQHPEVGLWMAYSTLPKEKLDHYALQNEADYREFNLPHGEEASFKSPSPEEEAMLSFYAATISYQEDAPLPRLFYWHGKCPYCLTKTDDNNLYLYNLIETQKEFEHGTLTGLALKRGFLVGSFLPQLIRAFQNQHQTETLALDLAILDERNAPLFQTNPARTKYEFTTEFTPVFARWQLAVAYHDDNVAALAERSFQRTLYFTLFSLAVLLGGILLIVRATGRELKLAQEKSAFVANVSHELKTPLALIQMFAETLQAGRVRTPAKAQEYHDIIVNESRRLTALINNILNFSAIEAGRKEYQFAAGDVTALVRETLDSYQPYLQRNGFTLTTNLAEDLPPIQMDRDALAQALLNLLNNAVKYAGDEKTIHVELAQQNDLVYLAVKDRGIGIPKAEQQKIFEQFYRVGNDLVHNVKGTGLGLALVKHIIEAHRGNVRVESEPGAGSAFIVLLPIT